MYVAFECSCYQVCNQLLRSNKWSILDSNWVAFEIEAYILRQCFGGLLGLMTCVYFIKIRMIKMHLFHYKEKKDHSAPLKPVTECKGMQGSLYPNERKHKGLGPIRLSLMADV